MNVNKSLTYLAEALPIPGRASDLRKAFNRSLIKSFIYLLGLCEEAIPPERFSNAMQKLNALDTEKKFSGLLSALHADFFNAVEQQDVQRVNAIVIRLSEDQFQPKDIEYVNLSTLNDYYRPMVETIFSAGLGKEREVKFFTLPPQEFEDVKELLQQAATLYQNFFPEFFAEFEELVSEILSLKSKGLKAGSSADLFGMIYKNTLFEEGTITYALDFLVHEQAHLYVHLLTKDDVLVLNALEKHNSPVRADKRPLIGIYHAVFVVARRYHILNKALSLNVIPEAEHTYCQQLIAERKSWFYEGFDLLTKHAQMTPLGEMLITSARKLV